MIKFPKVHIATSVTNRILKLAEQIAPTSPPASVRDAPPVVSDTASQSQALDLALATPPPELPGIDQAPDAGATLAGKPLLGTILEPGA